MGVLHFQDFVGQLYCSRLGTSDAALFIFFACPCLQFTRGQLVPRFPPFLRLAIHKNLGTPTADIKTRRLDAVLLGRGPNIGWRNLKELTTGLHLGVAGDCLLVVLDGAVGVDDGLAH